MNRQPAPKVLLASGHADLRVAVSWMLRQSFPDAIISKVENLADVASVSTAETPACVIVDEALQGFASELARVSQSLRQLSIPLIVIHGGLDPSQFDDEVCSCIAAWLGRSSVNADSIHIAISNAVELSERSQRIRLLEHELQSAREEVASAKAAVEIANRTTNESPPTESVTESAVPLPTSQPDFQSAGIERPKLVTSGLNVSSDDERELAARVQNDLMPTGSPLVEGFDIAGLSIHAETTGGDYYDYLPMADDLLCISIGECSGRGLAPAMMMASLRAYLRVLASQTTDISDVLSRANTLITEDIGDEEFIVTLMLCQVDCRTRTLQYASAGHQAFLLDGDGNVDVLHSTGMPLGLRDETVIVEGSPRKIRRGEILLLASDGVQKMTSDSGEQFGVDRMLNLVKDNRNLPSRIIANYLRKACTEFASPQFQHDDVTIVIVKGDDS